MKRIRIGPVVVGIEWDWDYFSSWFSDYVFIPVEGAVFRKVWSPVMNWGKAVKMVYIGDATYVGDLMCKDTGEVGYVEVGEGQSGRWYVHGHEGLLDETFSTRKEVRAYVDQHYEMEG